MATIELPDEVHAAAELAAAEAGCGVAAWIETLIWARATVDMPFDDAGFPASEPAVAAGV